MLDWLLEPDNLHALAALIGACGALAGALAGWATARRAWRGNGARVLAELTRRWHQTETELRAELRHDLDQVHARLEDCLADRDRLWDRLEQLDNCPKSDCPVRRVA